MSECGLYSHLTTFHVPNLMSIFLASVRLSKESGQVQVWGALWQPSYGDELTPKLEDYPLVDCPWLLMKYICSYPQYMDAVYSIHNLRTHHAMVTGNPPNMELVLLQRVNFTSGSCLCCLIHLFTLPRPFFQCCIYICILYLLLLYIYF
jgi:hypothetical protein